MGCELSRLVCARGATGGEEGPLRLPRPAPPRADPRSPLTAKQQYCMLASWKGVFRSIETTGIILFVKLFEENEDLLHLFDIFKNLPLEQHATSEELAEHATKVMHTLDQGVKSLGDVDSFYAFVRHVGATHRRIKGFTADNFWKIEKPFLQAAQTTLGDRYTENIANIYTITIRFILENLVKGYEDAEPLSNGTTCT